MRYLSLGACLALLAFLATNLVASLVVSLVWRTARHNLEGVGPRARAGGLFLLSIAPTVTAWILVLGVFLPAFCRFEPRDTGEAVSPTLIATALASAALILTGLRRGWQASEATRRVVRNWLAHARPLSLPGLRIRAYAIPSEFPVVSLVGVVRPKLFVSERVLQACTGDELAAMARHECAHLASRDNLKRLALRLCPNPLNPLSAGRDLQRHWEEACEEAADDEAAGPSAPSALALAHALLRVARLAPAGSGPVAPLAALYSGGSIERRVSRLISNSPVRHSHAAWLVAARVVAVAPAVLTVAVLCEPSLLHSVHHLLEVVVETLP